MTRYKLTLEYDGTPFVGWQRQDNWPSVQAEVAAAAEAFCGTPVGVYRDGRTHGGLGGMTSEEQRGRESCRARVAVYVVKVT